jgi:hypothetical protein
MKRPRNLFAHAIAALGGGIVLTELFRYWAYDHTMEGGVIAIGFTIAFVGAYMADRKGALEGGGFIVDSATRIIAVVRSGRRSTDTAVVVTTDAPLAIPDMAKVPAPEHGE